MPTRRAALALASFVAAPRVLAQPTAKARVVGLLSFSGTPETAGPYFEPLVQSLREKGWVEGRNVTFHLRGASSDPAAAERAAQEFVARQVDVIAVSQTPAVAAVLRATRASPIPIVLVGVADPVGAGFIQSLARPGGNVTGTSAVTAGMGRKTLEILRELIPGLRKVAAVINPDDPFGKTLRRYIEDGARRLRIDVDAVLVGKETNLEQAVADMAARRPQALVVQPTVSRGIIRMALAHKLPAAGPNTNMIPDGCLMAYGPDSREMVGRSGSYVDRILRGAKPADLPVVEPSRFELVLNEGVAKSLGLAIPQSVLMQASRVVP